MRPDRNAQLVISIDLEMSWGSVHHGHPHDPTPYRFEREIVADVLTAMERYGIAATWAVVGHLFLDGCAPIEGVKHPEIVRPRYPWLGGDWYDLDPTTTAADAPTWYGPDLIETIRACAIPQEIASHSFGHIIVGEPGCSPDAFATDLAACRTVAEATGTDLRSFVYPRNSIGHLDVLARSGFTAFRGPTPVRFAGSPPWRRRLLSLLDRVRPLAATAVYPAWRNRLIDVPQTYLFDPGSRLARRLGPRLWPLLVRRRLRHAVRTGSLFHLWFHTHNLAADREGARLAMDVVFAEARAHIDRGRLESVTMGQVAERMAGGAHGPQH